MAINVMSPGEPSPVRRMTPNSKVFFSIEIRSSEWINKIAIITSMITTKSATIPMYKMSIERDYISVSKPIPPVSILKKLIALTALLTSPITISFI